MSGAAVPRAIVDHWVRCDKKGKHCANIGGATDATAYVLRKADVGQTVRLKVEAKNADGSTIASSEPTAKITAAAPANTSLPTIAGTPQETKSLQGTRGTWTGNPRYDDFWVRCDSSGGSCAKIARATRRTYTLTAADVGNTIRFRVEAKNSGGTTAASSVPTGIIAPATKAPPTTAGCTKSGGRIAIAGVSAPARLTIDRTQVSPSRVTFGTGAIVARFHVSACGGSVQGARLFVTAVPYQQFSVPREATTGRDGWATLHFSSLAGFPVNGKQQLIVMFVRARKGGEPILGGVSTRRLISFHVARR